MIRDTQRAAWDSIQQTVSEKRGKVLRVQTVMAVAIQR